MIPEIRGEIKFIYSHTAILGEVSLYEKFICNIGESLMYKELHSSPRIAVGIPISIKWNPNAQMLDRWQCWYRRSARGIIVNHFHVQRCNICQCEISRTKCGINRIKGRIFYFGNISKFSHFSRQSGLVKTSYGKMGHHKAVELLSWLKLLSISPIETFCWLLPSWCNQ